MMTAIIFLGIGSIMASGIMFRHQRLLTLIAAAGAFWSGQWLLLTLVDRVILTGNESTLVYLVGSFVLTIPWVFKLKAWSWPYRTTIGSGEKDFVVLVVLLGVLLAAWLVQSRNGFENAEWVTHGFYNGDTMTMMTLVEKSMLTDGLVKQNPFAANGYLEYPALWHAGMATFLKSLGVHNDWVHFLPILTYVQILVIVPMFFLLMDIFWPEPKRREENWLGVPSRLGVNLLQAGIIVYVMTVSWDNYIYPQSHFFLTGMFLLMLGLLITAEKGKGSHKIWQLVPAGVLALVLMLSNAVTGAAAIAITIAFYGWRLISRRDEKRIRLGYALGILVWVVVYLLWSPGDAVFGWPHFSYTSAESIMRLGPVVVALVVALVVASSAGSFVSFSIIMLMAMSVVTFLFSQRNIVVANAERFLYQGLLVGFPLLMLPLVRVYYWVINRVSVEARDGKDKVMVTGGMIAIVCIVGLPTLASGARAHNSLMRQDRQIVDLGYREMLEYVRSNTKAEDVFLTDPNTPWALPMFTGRAMLRANYWLSPKDTVLEDVNAAFDGNEEAQIASLQLVDYLIIKQEELNNWKLNEQEEVFRGGKISIYKTGQ